MSTAEAKEKYTEILTQSAVQKFGEEEKEALVPAIQQLAESLAAIAEFELLLEEEPGFFL